MPFGYLPYIQDRAAGVDITTLGSDMRVSYQSERLAGTGSLLTSNEQNLDLNQTIRKDAKKNTIIMPLVFIAGIGIFIMAIGGKK